MPSGPFGFPRLTSLGPFVSPDEIEPAYSLSEGVYEFGRMQELTPETAEMVAVTIEDFLFADPNAKSGMGIADTKWNYRRMSVGKAIEGNSFAKSLNSFMVKLEEKYGDGVYELNESGEVAEYPEVKPRVPEPVEKEIRMLSRGEESIITEEELLDIEVVYERYLREDDIEALNQTINGVADDLIRVQRIMEGVRGSDEYWPPAVEEDAEEEPMGFGTIDGSHRVVAYNTLIGEGEEVYVWEWDNEEEFIR